MINDFIAGGKLGDFVHFLFAVKHLSAKNDTKANIHIVDIGWERGVDIFVQEIKDILLSQSYVQSVNILKDYYLHPVQRPEESVPIQVFEEPMASTGFVDMGEYIRSPWLYKKCWSEIISLTFGFEMPKEYKWISYDSIDTELQSKVVIFRRNNPYRLNHIFPFDQIIERFGKDNILFVSFDDNDYEAFPYKHLIEYKKIYTIDDMFKTINSSALTISNLSAPAAIAHALDKLRIIELPNTLDYIHCVGEEKYSDKVHWFLNSNLHNL